MSGIKIQHLPQYTVSDYEQWEGNWELIDGIPYAMSPSANKKHQIISSNLYFQIRQQLDECSCKILYELDWRINENNILRPDLVIVCDDDQREFIYNTPALIIEILSPSTAEIDKVLKYNKYETAGLPWYIIVDPETYETIIYQLVDNSYLRVTDSEFILEGDCSVAIDWERVFKD
jgi:Uma2 family endonuclease